MQSRIWGAVIFMLFLAALIPGAHAFLYSTTTGKLVYEDTALTDPYSPKIACNPEATKCIMLVYDDNSLATKGVKVIYSTDDFTDCSAFSSTCRTLTTIVDDYTNETLTATSYNYGYGVVYNETLNKWFIFSKNKIYQVSSGLSFSTNRTITCGVIGSGCTTNYRQCENVRVLDFIGPANVLVAYADQYYSGSGFINKVYIHVVSYNFFTATTTDVGCSATIGNTYQNIATNPGYAYGFVENVTAQKSEIIMGIYNNTGSLLAGSYDTIAYTGDYIGLHHYTPDYLFYPRAENITANISAGIWVTDTTDFVAFGSPALYYALDGSIAEEVNHSATFYNGEKKYLVWDRYSNSTGNGIYMEIETNKPITIESTYSMTATLSTGTYTTEGTGTIFVLYSPENDANITFDSSYTPGASTIDFNFSGCSYPIVSAIYENAPYIYTIKVVDAVTNLPISGASVLLDAETDTTDANGLASFTIQPIDTPTFILDKQGCNYYLRVAGTPKTYLASISYAGYVTTNYYLTPGEEKTLPIGATTSWTFEKNKTLTIAPNGVLVNVHVLTDDNIEIFPSSYTAYVTGNNGETWAYKGTLRTLRDYLTSFPAVFLLFDNRTTYNISVTLDYPMTNITQTHTVTVNNEYDIEIQIPYSLAELPCAITDDCSPTYCDSSGFFNYLNGCQGSRCQYTETDCISPTLCDPGMGCFETATETACTRDLDCNNSCVDNSSMLLEKCGADGFCKQIYRECSEGCNVTVGVCEESKDCIIGDSISVGWLYASGLIDHRKTLECDLSNSGKAYCQHGPNLALVDFQARGKTFADLRTYPDGWSATLSTDRQYLQLGDYVLACSDSCGASVTFCAYGCSDETNQCLSPASSGSNAATTYLTNSGLAWVISIWWYVLSMIVGVVILYLFAGTAGFNNSVGWEMFGVVIILMMGVGLAIPEVSLLNPFIGLLLIIVCALALASKFVPSK
jgi:hypothetical protein